MNRQNSLPMVDLEPLRALDTCTVSNAIERLNVRMRNEGFVRKGVRCRFPEFPPLVGYAATGRIRTMTAPVTHRCYYDRMDWWSYVASVPGPRVMVLQDVDDSPGLAAWVGEIHAAIGLALGCVGCVTNGAVRDLPAAKAAEFHLFSGSLSVSHSYAHIVEFGEPVELGGLTISSGDLIHGDRHGILKIPLSIAAEVPQEASKIVCEERKLIEFCHSPGFSLEELGNRIKAASADCDSPWRKTT
jgi:4-hydroxy-4-methyl-2-oxoglutarate aldolase